jgi:MFS transporter, OFA family, oxalate/formate antiporter
LLANNINTTGYKYSPLKYAVIIASSFLVTVCTGAAYAWSIFVAPLKEAFNYSTTDTQLVYGAMLISIGVVMLFVNKIMRKHGPRITSCIGAVLFCIGYIIASQSHGNLVILILSMGLVTGSGIAFGFVAVLNNMVRWLPNHKGLATGLGVCGYGGGAILLSQVADYLLRHNWFVLDIFLAVGIMWGILFLGGSLFLTTPRWFQPKPEDTHLDLKQFLKDKRFWVLFYVFFAGSFAGLLFNGNLKPIGISYGVAGWAGSLAITLFSVGNASGRLFWGFVHDLIGGRKVVTIALSLLILFSLSLLVWSANNFTFLVIALIIGLNYGANFVAYAADTQDIWGIARLDIAYPIISLAYGIAGVIGPVVGGAIRDTTGSYYVALIIGAVVCATGIVVYNFMMPQVKRVKASQSVKQTVEVVSSEEPR